MVAMLKQSREKTHQRSTRNAGGSKASSLTEELEAREKNKNWFVNSGRNKDY
jgi:hypothetical protein